jgi:hypothetical protein
MFHFRPSKKRHRPAKFRAPPLSAQALLAGSAIDPTAPVLLGSKTKKKREREIVKLQEMAAIQERKQFERTFGHQRGSGIAFGPNSAIPPSEVDELESPAPGAGVGWVQEEGSRSPSHRFSRALSGDGLLEITDDAMMAAEDAFGGRRKLSSYELRGAWPRSDSKRIKYFTLGVPQQSEFLRHLFMSMIRFFDRLHDRCLEYSCV